MTSAGPTPENEGIDPELQAAVESAFEEVPDGVREGLAQGSPEGAAGQADAASDEAAGEDPLAQAQAQAAQAADDLARARADLYNLQQEYQGFVRRSREGAASHRDAGAAGVVEALMATESSEVTEPTIAAVLQPGYRLGERVVRAARVQVANPA